MNNSYLNFKVKKTCCIICGNVLVTCSLSSGLAANCGLLSTNKRDISGLVATFIIIKTLIQIFIVNTLYILTHVKHRLHMRSTHN